MSRKSNHFEAKAYFLGRYECGQFHDYLILHGGDEVRKIIGAENVDKDKTFRVREFDGIPNTVMVVKKKYLDSILRCTTYTQLFNFLLQKLADNDIKNFFYPVWLGNHNYQAKRRNATTANLANHNRKHKVSKESCRHHAGSHSGMSSRQAARTYGAL